MISRDVELTILRLHEVEKWPPGTIASLLGLHHDVVDRVLSRDGAGRPLLLRPSALDPYLVFVLETWEKYPRLGASRLWAMCRERGYPGARDHFRHMVMPFRPRPRGEAFLRLSTLPGEQAQFDWADFGLITIGERGHHRLLAFVAVLSWSRALFARFFLDQKVSNLLAGHEAAFEAFKGVPRIGLYDNAKTVVLERVGEAIRYHPLLLEFAGHYRYEPRAVPPVRPNEKGRVERAIRYLRGAFFPGRKWTDLADLNAQAEVFCGGEAMDRPWPQDLRRTVRDAFAEEREKLRPLPASAFPTDERREVAVGRTPYARFDGNDYSVPHTLVRRTVVVLASPDTVRVLCGTEEVARHPRSFDKGRVIEDPRHVADLLVEKHAAREHRGMDRLSHAAPATRDLLIALAERGKNLGYATVRLLGLLDTYGPERLEAAVKEVLAGAAPHVHAVRQVLERQRAEQGLPPALPLPLPEDERLRNLRVRPHPLSSYDQIGMKKELDHDDDHGDGVPVA